MYFDMFYSLCPPVQIGPVEFKIKYLSIKQKIVMNNELVIKMKLLWCILRHYPKIFQEQLRKTKQILVTKVVAGPRLKT
jgi:hypothetical protein